MSTKRVVIGVTGRFGAGCSTTKVFFEQELNFKGFCLSTSLKEQVAKEVSDFDQMPKKNKRKILQDKGDALRDKSKDSGILARNVINKIKKECPSQNVVVDSIRNPEA